MNWKLKAGILVVIVAALLCLQASGAWTASIPSFVGDKFPFDKFPFIKVFPFTQETEDPLESKEGAPPQTGDGNVPYVSMDEGGEQEIPYEYGFPKPGYNKGLSMTPLTSWGLQAAAIVALVLVIYVFVVKRKRKKKKRRRKKK